jgi:hypothetical protein
MYGVLLFTHAVLWQMGTKRQTQGEKMMTRKWDNDQLAE